jgi:HTH-type transcriptional regulator/antitoxin HigA
MKIDGCVFKVASGNPVIGISFRYTRLDHFWFTLMHELAHVALHQEQLSSPILDDLESERPDLIEREADRLASDSLIPRNEWRNCPAKYSLAEADVRSFAQKMGIAPQIVAGRLRREFRRHELFSGLVNEVNVREILLGEG